MTFSATAFLSKTRRKFCVRRKNADLRLCNTISLENEEKFCVRRKNADLSLSLSLPLSLQEESQLAFYTTKTEDVRGPCSLLLEASKVPSRASWRDVFVIKIVLPATRMTH